MTITSIIRPLLLPRLKALDSYARQAEELQMKTLLSLLRKGADTQWGRMHQYGQVKSYEQFARLHPVNTYEELKAYIERMRQGEADVLWPGTVKWYAKSSGTTSDKSKFIPVSRDGLHDTHYRGGTDAVVWYLRNYPRAAYSTARPSSWAEAMHPTITSRTALWATSVPSLSKTSIRW